jgi:hypothetical protein
MSESRKTRLSAVVEKIKRLFGREPRLPEEDPYVYVTAPKKPRPPCRSAAAVADEPDR